MIAPRCKLLLESLLSHAIVLIIHLDLIIIANNLLTNHECLVGVLRIVLDILVDVCTSLVEISFIDYVRRGARITLVEVC